MGVFLDLLHSQFFVTPPSPTADCAGRTVLVTGANTGLGKEAARHLVGLNADKVIITSRNAEKGEAAKRDIESTTNRKDVVEVWPLDLEDYDSVKTFAQRVNGLPRVDAIIENAGSSPTKFRLAGGNESTVTVNVVSTFLLALLVIPKLQETARKFDINPTLTIVSSEVHGFTSFPERKSSSIFGTLNDPKKARMSDRYNVSKLLEVLACREIAQAHPVSRLRVTLNFVNPGFCHSELTRDRNQVLASVAKAVLARTTEVGSRTLVHAGAVAGIDTHGKYLADCIVKNCSSLVEGKEGPELQRRVWAELSEKLEQIQPGVTKNLDS